MADSGQAIRNNKFLSIVDSLHDFLDDRVPRNVHGFVRAIVETTQAYKEFQETPGSPELGIIRLNHGWEHLAEALVFQRIPRGAGTAPPIPFEKASMSDLSELNNTFPAQGDKPVVNVSIPYDKMSELAIWLQTVFPEGQRAFTLDVNAFKDSFYCEIPHAEIQKTMATELDRAMANNKKEGCVNIEDITRKGEASPAIHASRPPLPPARIVLRKAMGELLTLDKVTIRVGVPNHIYWTYPERAFYKDSSLPDSFINMQTVLRNKYGSSGEASLTLFGNTIQDLFVQKRAPVAVQKRAPVVAAAKRKRSNEGAKVSDEKVGKRARAAGEGGGVVLDPAYIELLEKLRSKNEAHIREAYGLVVTHRGEGMSQEERVKRAFAFAGILMDFKRIGDLLQVRVSEKHKTNFVSNDINACTIAATNPIHPTMRTSYRKESGHDHRARNIVFYNLNQKGYEAALLKYHRTRVVRALQMLNAFEVIAGHGKTIVIKGHLPMGQLTIKQFRDLMKRKIGPSLKIFPPTYPTGRGDSGRLVKLNEEERAVVLKDPKHDSIGFHLYRIYLLMFYQGCIGLTYIVNIMELFERKQREIVGMVAAGTALLDSPSTKVAQFDAFVGMTEAYCKEHKLPFDNNFVDFQNVRWVSNVKGFVNDYVQQLLFIDHKLSTVRLVTVQPGTEHPNTPLMGETIVTRKPHLAAKYELPDRGVNHLFNFPNESLSNAFTFLKSAFTATSGKSRSIPLFQIGEGETMWWAETGRIQDLKKWTRSLETILDHEQYYKSKLANLLSVHVPMDKLVPDMSGGTGFNATSKAAKPRRRSSHASPNGVPAVRRSASPAVSPPSPQAPARAMSDMDLSPPPAISSELGSPARSSGGRTRKQYYLMERNMMDIVIEDLCSLFDPANPDPELIVLIASTIFLCDMYPAYVPAYSISRVPGKSSRSKSS